MVIEQAPQTTTVRADSATSLGDAIFVGTELPKDVPSWVPTVAPEYVRSVQQAGFVPGMSTGHSELRGFMSGRYVFESNHSEESLIQHMDKVFTARGFVPGMNLGGNILGVVARGDHGTMRFARFGVTQLPTGKSRADLSFVQMPVSLLMGVH